MTLQEVKDQYAKEQKLQDWQHRGFFDISDADVTEIATRYAEAKCKEQREICRDEINNFGVDDLPEEYYETSDRMEAFVAEHAPAPKMD